MATGWHVRRCTSLSVFSSLQLGLLRSFEDYSLMRDYESQELLFGLVKGGILTRIELLDPIPITTKASSSCGADPPSANRACIHNAL